MANASAGAEQPDSSSNSYDCHICLDAAKDPVVSLCGHLFCWSCLHRWMETQTQEWGQAACPVCKAVIDRERVVPLYGRGGSTRDPRNAESPPRPRPQRTEFPDHQEMPFFGDNLFGHNVGGFHFSFGIGTFPFGLLYSNISGGRQAESGNRPADNRSLEDVLANVFLYLGVILMFGVLFAE